MGFNMRMISVLKAVSLAAAVAAVANVPVASARMKLPPGACAFHGKVVAAATTCSYQCDPKTNWCMQQTCLNGKLSPAFLPTCISQFCPPKCG